MNLSNDARFKLVAGAVLTIPGVVAIVVFVTTANAAAALQSANTCPSPTRDAGSTCLSMLRGQVTGFATHSQVTIALEDTTVTVGFDCSVSPTGACGFAGGYPNPPIETAWWRGHVVFIGSPVNGTPAVMTSDNPYHQLMYWMPLLLGVIPGIALLVAGILSAQAPLTLTELMKETLATWPDPPREVDRATVRRVAWGYRTDVAWLVWGAIFFLSCFALLLTTQWRWALLALVASFFSSYGVVLAITPTRLYRIIRDSDRLRVVVERYQDVKGGVKVWYRRPAGTEGTGTLDPEWLGHVQVGDPVDSLVDPRSGEIRLVLSAPPAQV